MRGKGRPHLGQLGQIRAHVLLEIASMLNPTPMVRWPVVSVYEHSRDPSWLVMSGPASHPRPARVPSDPTAPTTETTSSAARARGTMAACEVRKGEATTTAMATMTAEHSILVTREAVVWVIRKSAARIGSNFYKLCLLGLCTTPVFSNRTVVAKRRFELVTCCD